MLETSQINQASVELLRLILKLNGKSANVKYNRCRVASNAPYRYQQPFKSN